MKKEIKEKLDLLVKLDKALVECDWDYQLAVEYRHFDKAKDLSRKNEKIGDKMQEIWDSICKEYGVERQWHLPQEVEDYYNNGTNKNRYDRFNDWERDLRNLGIRI